MILFIENQDWLHFITRNEKTHFGLRNPLNLFPSKDNANTSQSDLNVHK